MDKVLVKPARCLACRQCNFACAVEHSRSRDPACAALEDPPPRSRIQVRTGRKAGTAAPAKCRHCDPAPCQASCPTGAISREAKLGLVLLDEALCTACASCAEACPFGAVAFQDVSTAAGQRQVAVKCDGCATRLERSRIPACAEACKSGALVFAPREVREPARVRQTGLAAEPPRSPIP